MALKNMFTIAGVLITDALAQLDRLLPELAYRPITGGPGAKANLTDVGPAFEVELISELFGPLGIGWGYEETEFVRDGTYIAVKIRCWYNLYDEKGAHVQTVEWAARGGNSNGGNKEWAEKGALTNALGAAWSLQGLQKSVYKGIRSHETVTKEWRDKRAASKGITPEANKESPSPNPTETASASADGKIPTAGSVMGALKAAGVPVALSKDGETVFAIPAYGNAAQKAAVSKAAKAANVEGSGWDKGIPSTLHGLSNKSGAYVIPVSSN